MLKSQHLVQKAKSIIQWEIYQGSNARNAVGQRDQSYEPGRGTGLHKECANRRPVPEGLASQRHNKCYTSRDILMQMSF